MLKTCLSPTAIAAMMLCANPALAVDTTVKDGAVYSGNVNSPGSTVTVTGEGSIYTGALTAGHLNVSNGGTATVTTSDLESAVGGSNNGVAVVQNGSVVVHGGSISNVRADGWGNALFAGAGANVELIDVDLSTSGTNTNPNNSFGSPSSGIFANDGGQVVMTGGSVLATGAVRGLGLQTEGGLGEVITATGVDVSAAGKLSVGVLAFGNGAADQQSTINFADGSIAASGEDAVAIQAEKLDARINVSGTNVTTTGAGGTGVAVDRGAIITLADTAINTSGRDAVGIHSWLYSGDVRSAVDGINVTIDTTGNNSSGVVADGADVFLTDASISTSGHTAYGVQAVFGGNVTLEGGNIGTTGSRSYGLVSQNAESQITSSADVTTEAEWTFGAYALDDGSINLTGGTVTTNGLRAHGLLAEQGGMITSAATVTTNGDRAHGAQAGTAEGGGHIVLADGSVITSGDMAYGLLALNGGTITGDINISTSGDGSSGVSSDGDGYINLTGQVVTSGTGSHGIQAVYDDRFVAAGVLDANMDVTTTGAGSYGVYAKDGGTITLTGGKIATSGAGAHGLAVEGATSLAMSNLRSSIEASAVSITTNAGDAYGIAFMDGGKVTLTDSNVTSAGTATGVSLTSGLDADLTVAGSTITSGNGVFLDILRTGDGAGAVVTANITDGSVVTGEIRDAGKKNGGYANVLIDAAELRGTLKGVNLFSLSNGGTWTATGNADVENLTIGQGGGVINAMASEVGISGGLTGTGMLTKAGAGTLRLTGDNTGFDGMTTISEGRLLLTGTLDSNITILANGTMQIGDGGTEGDLTGSTVNNGTLIFARSDDYDYTGNLSGNGSLFKRGDGLLVLSGEYLFTGTTKVEGGSVRLEAELDPGSDLVVDGGSFDLGDQQQTVSGLSGTSGVIEFGSRASLTVNQESDSTFGGSLSGSGVFTKSGSASLNLTGVSNFTGSANVDEGRLAVNGVLPGTVTVNEGGVIGGHGTIAKLNLASGGIAAPGNSIGTLNITDSVNFDAGSIYQVEVNAAGNNDKIITIGSANIEGGTVSVIAAEGNYARTTSYTILTAEEGVNGEFDEVDTDSVFLDPYLSYTGTSVGLTLDRNDVTFVSLAQTTNQLAVATALDGSSPATALYNAAAYQNATGALEAFDALSGEVYASTSTVLVDEARRVNQAVLGRLRQADTSARGLGGGSAVTETSGGRTAIWGQASGSWNKIDSDGNAGQVKQDVLALTTGIDTQLGAWRIGAAFSHAKADLSVNARSSTAETRSDTVSAYAGGGWGNLKAHLGVSYGWVEVDGERTVAFPGFSDEVSSSYDGKTASAFAELSYAATLGTVTVEPFAGINHVHLKTDGFRESGGVAALAVSRRERDVTFSTLGLRLGTDIAASEKAVVTPMVSAAWQHGFGDVEAKGRHVLGTGAGFDLRGVPMAKDNLALEAGVQASIMPGGTLGISYTGNIADRWNDHGLKLGLSFAF